MIMEIEHYIREIKSPDKNIDNIIQRPTVNFKLKNKTEYRKNHTSPPYEWVDLAIVELLIFLIGNFAIINPTISYSINEFNNT